ncbi:MAG: glucoamylase family protein [Candidatus Hydrogenedentes bacterium]|nr:glucoamylase family protein [Candidatus Hydrogenedentota bacterium]
MPPTLPPLTKTFGRLSNWYQTVYHTVTGNGIGFSADEQPLRAELYSVHQLELHAKAVAATHELAARRTPNRLIARLEKNERVLTRTYESLAIAVEKKYQITPAAEWLLDSFYAIEDQIRAARRHLPRSFSQSLPQLSSGPAAGMPRVYGIATELISHADGAIDNASLGAFIAAYQTITPLTLGELWAIPIMLRLALIENLRRVSVRVAASLRDRDEATEWALRMVTIVEKNPTDLVLVLADMARADPPLTSTFVAELTRHLHGQSPHFAFAQGWLEHRLSERGVTISQLVQIESQTQAADQVSIGNSITSLRLLGSTDWRDFVESQSVVESVLRHDPGGVYADMGFVTRDRYRHVVEQIAKYAGLPEADVALHAVRLAEAAFVREPGNRCAHVGYYLIDKGRDELERRARMRAPVSMKINRAFQRHPLLYYVSGIAALALCVILAFFQWTGAGEAPVWMLAAIAAPALMCATQFAINVVNWLVTIVVAPKPPPRMDFRAAIPREHRTMVVIPTLITSKQGIHDLLDRLEVHYVGNSDKHLHFALLTDLKDASQEILPEDEALVRRAREGIEALNEKYADDRRDIFFLFHRPRKWSAADKVWMGYERKRGKLREFTGLLRGGSFDSFSEVVGDVQVLPEIQYVITLDTDTLLPRDAARELTGAMAHPLNRPVIDARLRRVVEGYGILQPRVAISLPTASKSWFVRLFAIDSGLDPYTRVVSDVYQDVFGEGTFIGKGIYDVDAFHQTCDHFPENAILSHDLLESAYARSALMSDVELYEDYPSRYAVDASRRHRWIRGDWQIARWIMPRVHGPEGRSVKNPISALSWWKIADNLRRSLVPPAMIALLTLGWLFSWPLLAAYATGLVVAVFVVAPLLSAIAELARKPVDLDWFTHFRAYQPDMAHRAAQVLFNIIFLPYEAFLSLDAVTRTLARVWWTRRRMLEWTTSSDAERFARTSLAGHMLTMWAGPAAAALLGIATAMVHPGYLIAGAPLLLLWLFSPVIAWWVSRTLHVYKPDLDTGQLVFLRKLARKTWRYFEVFVTPEENWLPPDNYQEQPKAAIASRTSPTNIGVALLANLTASDFGYCTTGELLLRTQNTLATMGRLEKYRGHFYNWYDTQTLRPLPPHYVSTVDSGNLAMHLLILRCGLLEFIDARVFPASVFTGIQDTASVLYDVIHHAIETQEPGKDSLQLRECQHLTEQIVALATDGSRSLSGSALLLNRIADTVNALEKIDCGSPEGRWWTAKLVKTIHGFQEELAQTAPWVLLESAPEKMWSAASGGQSAQLEELRDALARLERIPTLRQVAESRHSLLPRIDAALVAVHAAGAVSMEWLTALRRTISDASRTAIERIRNIEEAASLCLDHASMDFGFLYDKTRDLMAIGYNVSDHRLDTGFYDLLASEARTASYFAIAQGQLDQEHWFAMRRMLTTSTGAPALLSWNGSMFEYLMPLLVMPTYENTLLDRTCKAIVFRQIAYGKQRGIPWGVSESGYNTLDVHLNYQYRGFGVPGLGLKRGLVDDLVVAPYASALALMVAPEEACKNLERLASEGRAGAYGLYEAIDYTATRLPRGASSVTVRSFMAHHQGMSLLAFSHVLLNRPMQRRFAADPALRANELLLQERVPRTTAPIYPHAVEASTSIAALSGAEDSTRVFSDPGGSAPEVHLLSNGRYHVMVSSAGGGYSRWGDFAVTRWHEDATRDCWGTFCYLRDTDSGRYWSVAHQPALKSTKPYEAIFAQGKAEFRRRDDEIETHTEISVSPEDDIELRRITLTNRSDRPRNIELTSYAEVVLAPVGQDLAHPALSNLFLQTELIAARA